MTKEAANPALTDLYTQPGHLMRRAQQISASIFYDELGSKITPIQYAVLRILVEHPGIDQVSLAGLVAIDTSTAASVAIRLEEKKLLVRYLDPNNRRQRALYLTDAGRALLQSTIPGIQRLHQRIFEGFSAEEEAQFMALLTKLVHINNSKSRAPLSQRRPAPTEISSTEETGNKG
ncbi:MAG TPA: MarR family transcriptional regulator [Pusillimonas sp.]|uniref:MarR family winged helix-turn-helix transcriptional regulator n=1 Tax=unclassified Pusillimonas TaxID=2640016 RepID=UPI002621E961|nr:MULTISPECIES: MarR family transcriptional regulator [unclassified Pusillimonas]HLU19275.1 MarR family transcriptional regulator [Pusillimonas sp.]